MNIVLKPIINAAGLVPFIESLGAVPQVERKIALDFSVLRRVSPAGLVTLVATVARWQAEHRQVSLDGLARCPICGYLQRMDALRLCGVDLAEDFARHAALGRFVPVQLIVDVDSMSREVAACLAPSGEEHGDPLAPAYDLAAYVLGELGANVRQHSRGRGYVAAQTSVKEGLVRLAVADNGVGVRQSFIDAGLPWSVGIDDVGALKMALQPRVSSRGKPVNEGVGLTLVYELARLAEAWLMIVSGTGLLRMNPDGILHASGFGSGAAYRGTLVALTFRRDKLREFAILLDEAKQQAGLLPKRPIKGMFT